MNSAKIQYLYITGASCSGSTLLAFLLNAHPQMVSTSEMPIACRYPGSHDGLRRVQRRANDESFPCSCGAPVLQCHFYKELQDRINALPEPFSLEDWQAQHQLSKSRSVNILLFRPLRSVFLEDMRDRLVTLWPGYQRVINTVSYRIAHFARAALSITGKEIFADVHKDSMRIRFLRASDQLNLKIIHLVRDVRGSAVSIMNHTRTDDLERATRVWYNANMNSDRARRYVIPYQWMRITYDELCRETQGTMDRISDFVGVERSTIPEDFYKVEHHIIGNRMRLKGSGGIVKLDESWKDRLTKHDLDVIARIGGTANRYFGHDWP
jgi:hypothetical protein